MKIELRPVWEQCKNCDEYICNLHKVHVHECECPEIEQWVIDLEDNPYDILIPVFEANK